VVVPASSLVVENDGPIRIVSSNSTPTPATPNRLRGMAVNDLTKPTAPRAFVPSGRVIDISELPDATITDNPTKTSSSTSGSNDEAWTTRKTTLRVAGS
jgi:hypothetical protein